MARPEDSAWAVSVAQVASRPGQSSPVDADFPAPSGIGDVIVGVTEGEPIHVNGAFDSIIDGLVFHAHITAPVHAECTRCLKPLQHDWGTDVTAFFPYSYKEDETDDDTDIIAGEEESEGTYPLSPDGCFADLEALLRDTFAESLPLQPLCQPDCKGLCPQCGINLNEHPEHKHDTTDIRFAALAGLKEQLERETKDR
ncbi:YceD family protein [Bifidobacterium thermophilum]|uniref:YceD family protein n=1 Tax=Bifidobacterium thermophilum TaxID=33905 RepID=UPI003994AF3C